MEQNPSDGRTLALETLAVGAGYDPAEHGGAAKPPIYMTSTFVYASAAQARAVHQAFFDGDVPERSGKNGYIYARLDHPNLVMAQTRIAALDRAEDCCAFRQRHGGGVDARDDAAAARRFDDAQPTDLWRHRYAAAYAYD